MRRAGTIRLSETVRATLERAATGGYPSEICGLLLGRSTSTGVSVERFVSVPNAAPADEQRRRYVIEPRVLLEWDRIAQASSQSIVGFAHSHPDHPAKPSATDAALAWPSYVYLIVSVVGRPNGETPIVSGLSAWTFDEPSSSFREHAIELAIDASEIEYYI